MGQIKIDPHPDRFPLGFKFKFSDEHARLCHVEVPPYPTFPEKFVLIREIHSDHIDSNRSQPLPPSSFKDPLIFPLYLQLCHCIEYRISFMSVFHRANFKTEKEG